ncbi:MAG: transporter substrate-binding domain-containing protein [Candidatus Dojkabacteria bacterium]|uniref:Bacterial extracellular solute-binding protein, family 3 n=2 Tax=Candidatus Dojkabacteria TaxID=74243 RepID=A0A136KIY1_9BACT|nr:MAG: Bacterial extracellular solute-binding protein, family 3 [candidate division WS6 bacterium OLB21]MBW7954007.1 transporter substrate-binding domain-containing protein [Candidatus Dojkabacteria bacterium]WKZ27711.1 MAG: transporter substrate-binding domain-containing protein [Candidatus Dojkabacteria bacterium]
MKTIFLIVVFFFSLILPPTVLASSPQVSNTASRNIRVAIYNNPPKISTDSEGNVKGFWPDILEYIAEKENWNIVYENAGWDEGLEKLRRDQVDIMVDVGYFPERAEIFEFANETAFINWASVYSRPGMLLSSFTDLEGLRIAVMKEDIHSIGPLGIRNLIKNFDIKATFVEFDSYEENLQAIEDNIADVAVVNRLFGTFSEKDYNVSRSSIVFNPVELKFALSKNSDMTPYLKEALDRHMLELKADSNSIYYTSILENLEKIVEPVEVEVEPGWIRPFALISGLILTLGIVYVVVARRYNLVLTRNVEDKTKQLLKSETRFKHLTDLLPQVVFETDDSGLIKYINKSSESLFGQKPEEITNILTICKLIHDEAGNKINYLHLLSHPDKALEMLAIRKDGSKLAVMVYVSPIIEENSIKGIRGIIIDIHENKDIRTQLANKVKELEKAIDTMVEREISMAELKEEIKKGQ